MDFVRAFGLLVALVGMMLGAKIATRLLTRLKAALVGTQNGDRSPAIYGSALLAQGLAIWS